MYLDIPALLAILIALGMSVVVMILAVAHTMQLEKHYNNKIYKLKTEIRQLKDSYR